MRGSFPISRARRRGQALLLAVLIMIFAALISAAFIGVVSTNLNQTARQTDKDRAVVAAQAGLDYVNRQLTYSAEGDKWRTPLVSNPPLPGDVSYSTYYSPLDVAQGWAGQYSKFPDPRGPVQNGPQFLAKVERVPFGSDRAGSLKITVIGLSADDPTAWHRLIAYKGGYNEAPIAQMMRTVSNWDFKNNIVPVAETVVTAGISPTNPTTPALAIKNAKSDFSVLTTPFTVTVSVQAPTPSVQSAVVKSVALPVPGDFTQFTLNLAKPLTTLSPGDGQRVELAANLGAPVTLNLGNDPTNPTALSSSPTNLQFNFSDGATPDGARANGGLILSGDLLAQKLRGANKAFASSVAPGALLASGVIALEDPAHTVKLSGPDMTATANLVASSDTNFPGTSAGWPTSVIDKDQLVSDGWNRIKGGIPGVNQNNLTRSISNFLPPNFSSGEGLERYRNMARLSKPATGYTLAADSLYGYGEGIYIDNGSDKEKTINGTNPPKEMSQIDLIKLWFNPKAATENFNRSVNPLAITNANASLEDQHLRGWVTPDEFRARGVEIQLKDNGTADPTLLVTRDARDDGTTNNLGPVDAKAWKDPTTGVSVPGLYQKELPWPANGVVFAEGNVRIKGVVANAKRSLTVVSMNNIYIEDSLDAGPKKVLLLAKRNVVMNPTRVVSMPDEQTVTTATSSPATFLPSDSVNLTVSDASRFKKGDYIRISTVGGATLAQGYVTQTPTTSTGLQFKTIAGGSITTNSIVRTPNAIVKAVASPSLSQSISFSPIGSISDVIQRRLNVTSTNQRLALNHAADNNEIFTIKATSTGATPATKVFLSGKMVPNTSAPPPALPLESNVTTADKILRAEGVPTTPTDSFPTTPSATETLKTVADYMTSTPHNDVPNNIGWSYAAKDFATTDVNFANVPFYYLAGFGNRQLYAITTGSDWRQDIIAAQYKVPLATSIGLWLNGTPSILTNERWNTTGTPAYDTTTQIGFNPNYNSPEDILTSDQGFYQKDPAYSTLDSRSLGALTVGSNSLVFQQSTGLTAPAGGSQLPDYRVRSAKLEDVNINNGIIKDIKSTHDFNINAFVYAQMGSWVIIPGPMFDERVRGKDAIGSSLVQTYLDLNGNGASEPNEFTKGIGSGGVLNTGTSLEPGDYADLNRNGALDDFEKYAVARYARYDYGINFNGAISENQTLLVNNSGTEVGAVADWMNKWVKLEILNADTATPTVTYNRIKYTFDPSVALASLDTDLGFNLPQTLQLSYES